MRSRRRLPTQKNVKESVAAAHGRGEARVQGDTRGHAPLLLEEAGRNLAPLPLLESIVYAGLPIERFGSETIATACLPGLVSGETLVTAALFEVGTPSLSRQLKTRAGMSVAGC